MHVAILVLLHKIVVLVSFKRLINKGLFVVQSFPVSENNAHVTDPLLYFSSSSLA